MIKNNTTDRIRFLALIIFVTMLLIAAFVASKFRTYRHEINLSNAELRTQSQLFGFTYKTTQGPSVLTFYAPSGNADHWIHYSTQDELSSRGYSMGMHFVLDLRQLVYIFNNSNGKREAKERIAEATLAPLTHLRDLNDYRLQEEAFLIAERRLTCITENLKWDDETEAFDLSMDEVERVLKLCDEFTPLP